MLPDTGFKRLAFKAAREDMSTKFSRGSYLAAVFESKKVIQYTNNGPLLLSIPFYFTKIMQTTYVSFDAA